MQGKQFWIGVVTWEHVKFGLNGGFVQLNHGKKVPLQNLHAGDGFVYYSPKTAYPDGDPLQMFTAIGIVKNGEVYQVEMADDFHPFRIDVNFINAKEMAFKLLIDQLSFIKDKTHWSAPFRFGNLNVPALDFKIIAEAMGCDFDRDFGG